MEDATAPDNSGPVETVPAETVPPELTALRRSIDNIDAALVHLLAERFKFTQEVGRLKAREGLPASDPGREKVQIARLRALAEESHLDPAIAEKFLNFIVAEVIHHHQRIAQTETAQTETAQTETAQTETAQTGSVDAVEN